MRAFYRTLRILSAITLFFFCWTFLPLYAAVAYAAAPEGQKSAASSQKSGVQQSTATSADRFEKALDSIRENVGKAGAKADKGEDNSKELETLKAKRAEIESADSDFKKEFAATEKKLKDANLPQEIRDRHAKFVKNYEDNLTLLKTNLDDVEMQKADSRKLSAALTKAKAHLEKVKSPSRHQKLDPNNLPFKARKVGKNIAPRLKKEDFERDFPKQKSQNKLKIAGGFAFYSAIRNPQSAISHKPILLAFNDTVSDVPFILPRPSGERTEVRGGFNPKSEISNPQSQLAFAASAPFLLALATDQPTVDDLAETQEVQFTDAIRGKAQELGGNPVKIYEWVRNNIEFVPTYGSIQGADMCLQSKQCNDFDTASLLIALLRSSGIYAHYSYGTIEVPIDKVMNWTGGFTDAVSALNFIASGGVPVTGLRSGGKIYAAQIEHVWVKAWIDYIPSMGAVHKQGNTWIPLDASYKQNTYTDGVDFQTAVPFDGQALSDQIKATATINEQDSSVTNVNAALIQSAQADYSARLENYVTQNISNATPGDILGKKEIIKKEQPILPASLPYKVIVAGTETSEISDLLRHKITIQLTDADNSGSPAFTYSTSLPQLAGKRFTVSYDPATSTDQTTINKYLEQYATSIPAYLVQFKPVLKIEGATVATGASIGMGNAQDLTISIISPKGTEIVTHGLLAGDYTAIGLNPSTISLDVFQNRINKNDFSEPVGEMLYQTVLSYWAEADAFNNIIAKTLRVNNLRHPSELAASSKVAVSYAWGVPSSATYNFRNIDVKLDNQTVTAKSSDKTKEFSYMQQSGVNSSFLEGAIMDQLFVGNVGDGISAVTALKAANDQGIPVYSIGSSNSAAILPQLQVADAIKTEISNATNAGFVVQISKTNIVKSGWSGVGYVVLNPSDGSAAYRISGGLNGGSSGTAVKTVIALPQIPVVGATAFVLEGMSTSAGSNTMILTTSAGTLEGVGIGGAGTGIGAGAAAGAAATAAAVLAAIILAIFIFIIVKSLLDKKKPEYRQFRNYTTFVNLGLIKSPPQYLLPSESGDIGPAGVYATDTVILDT